MKLANSEKQAREQQITTLEETVRDLRKKLQEGEEENSRRQFATAETTSSASEPEREVNGSGDHDSRKQELEQVRASCDSQRILLEERNQEKEQQVAVFALLQTRFASLEGEYEQESRIHQEQAQRIGYFPFFASFLLKGFLSSFPFYLTRTCLYIFILRFDGSPAQGLPKCRH